MRKTVIYLVILAILGSAIFFFFYKSNGYNPDVPVFNIKDTASIGKLFLATTDGQRVTVERTDSGWMVNKIYHALPSTLNLLLTTLAQQEALYPVTKSAAEIVMKGLATESIKIEVYDRKGNRMSAFHVGGIAVNNTGTNMLMDDSQTPYVVHIHNFNGYLSSRYTVLLRDWRDRTVFNIPYEEIKSVSIDYAGKPINSFEIQKDKDSVTIKVDPSLSSGLDAFNSRRAKVFLKYFANVNCEGFINGISDNDTSLATAPKQSTIDVQGIHGQRQSVDIYWMAVNQRSKNRIVSNPDVPDDYDADRLYAVINNHQDTVVIQQFAFRNIFHKAFEFYQKDGTGAVPKEEPKNVMMHKNE
jgi:Domain of unknown function (DUF4340)